jgi:hypothetical protein
MPLNMTLLWDDKEKIKMRNVKDKQKTALKN